MSKEKIYIFDTTLRDGAQTEGVNFSIDESFFGVESLGVWTPTLKSHFQVKIIDSKKIS